MISEVDIKDWLDKCDKAESKLEYSDASLFVSDFVREVRDYFKSQQKQVAALFKKPEGK